MKALYHGSIQRMATTGSAVARKAAITPTISHRASRRRQPFFTLFLGRRLGDHDVGRRHVLVAGTIRGRDLGDLVDDVHAGGDLAEYRVTVVGRPTVIEEVIVDQVHEELRSGAVHHVGARHRERAALVLEAIGGLVLDRRLGLLLLHAGLEAAAL